MRLLAVPCLAIQEAIEIFLAAFKAVECVFAPRLFYGPGCEQARPLGAHSWFRIFGHGYKVDSGLPAT